MLFYFLALSSFSGALHFRETAFGFVASWCMAFLIKGLSAFLLNERPLTVSICLIFYPSFAYPQTISSSLLHPSSSFIIRFNLCKRFSERSLQFPLFVVFS